MPQEKPSLSLQEFGVSDKDEGTPSKLVKQKVKRLHPKNIPLPFSLPFCFFLSFLHSFLQAQFCYKHSNDVFTNQKKPHPNLISNNDLHIDCNDFLY